MLKTPMARVSTAKTAPEITPDFRPDLRLDLKQKAFTGHLARVRNKHGAYRRTIAMVPKDVYEGSASK